MSLRSAFAPVHAPAALWHLASRVPGRVAPELGPLDAASVEGAWQRANAEVVDRLLIAAQREGLATGAFALHERSLVFSHDDLSCTVPVDGWGAWAQARRSPRADAAPLEQVWAHLSAALASTADVARRVGDELRSSRWHLAVAMLAHELRRRAFTRGSTDRRVHHPEHQILHGHPWHPMSRTRGGLDPIESLRYAPELLARVELRALSLPRRRLQTPGRHEDIERRLPSPAPDRTCIPVHPAQLRRLRTLPASFRAELRDEGPAAAGWATASFRTLELDDEVHIKTALAVHTTSARRTVSDMSVTNGPRVSALLGDIAERDARCAALRICGEDATIGLTPDAADDPAMLGAILRRAPRSLLGSEERAEICAALAEPALAHEGLRIRRLLAAYPSADALWRDYVEALCPPTLGYLVRWGVALEVHLQNTLVVTQDDRVRGFIVRDLGGIRIHRPRLGARGLKLDLADGSFIVTDDLDEVRDKLSHCLFQAHLGTIFEAMRREGAAPAHPWAVVRERIEDTMARAVEADAEDAVAWRSDLDHWLRPQVRAKALFSMRLGGRSSDYDYFEVDNPLAERR